MVARAGIPQLETHIDMEEPGDMSVSLLHSDFRAQCEWIEHHATGQPPSPFPDTNARCAPDIPDSRISRGKSGTKDAVGCNAGENGLRMAMRGGTGQAVDGMQ